MKNTNTSPNDMLIKAAMNGSLKGVKAACEAGSDVNTQHPDWGTALYIACLHHHSRIAHYLLQQPGIDITKGTISLYPQGIAGAVYLRERTEHNHTPLYAAVKNQNVTIIHMLLNHADRAKYLQPDENWQTCIKSTFNYGQNPFGVIPFYDSPVQFEKPCIFDILLEATEPYPELQIFTLSGALKSTLSWGGDSINIMAEYIRNRSAHIQALTFNCVTDLIQKHVRNNKEHSLNNCLEYAPLFGTADRLQPYLQAAHKLAQQLQHEKCANSLRAALAELN
ncbi:MAG: ankyrin repeat domain-containing protein [Akkermansia sp.]|nr:ankyrin repeat domain-containing protein [Akkermansia sp.]